MNKMINFYGILNLPQNASIAEVKSSYKKMAKELKKELKKSKKRNPNTVYQIKKLNLAYDILANEKTRKEIQKYYTQWIDNVGNVYKLKKSERVDDSAVKSVFGSSALTTRIGYVQSAYTRDYDDKASEKDIEIQKLIEESLTTDVDEKLLFNVPSTLKRIGK